MTILLLALAGWPGWAASQADLYVGEAIVGQEPDPARAPVLDALNQVLVRLTGQVGRDLVAELGIDGPGASELALGRQFRRESVPQPDGTTMERRVLRVDFDPVSINGLLEESSYQRWGRERPDFLLWVAEDEGQGAEYLGDDPVLQHAIDEAAFRYGFGLTRPILDASDRLEVTPADIRGGFTGVSTPAMKRYGADGVVMLDLRRNGSFWTGRWAWRIGGRETAFQRSGRDPAEVIRLGLGRIAESLAARFSVAPTRADTRRLVVAGIDTPAHYREVDAFLNQLTGVESVRPLSAAADSVTFEVRVASDGLRQRIELTGPLAFLRHDLAAGTLYYRFRL